MTEEAKKARREYERKYRETHKEQIKENRRRYWERKGAQLAAMEAAKDEQTETDKPECNISAN